MAHPYVIGSWWRLSDILLVYQKQRLKKLTWSGMTGWALQSKVTVSPGLTDCTLGPSIETTRGARPPYGSSVGI